MVRKTPWQIWMPVLNYTTFVQHPKRIHFIGIGGIGMSALALLCLNRGWFVEGSTLSHNESTQALIAQGAGIFLNHSSENLDKRVECVVYSSAIAENNPELQAARQRNIPIVHRSTLLRAFVHSLETIAISGTHGKTTTTSLLGHVFHTARIEPLILSGGMMTAWNSPVYPGKGSFAIVEADESDHSHINFSALSGAIITNVEADHMENYDGSLDNVWAAFAKFLHLATDFIVLCRDSIEPNNPWLRNLSCPITWYGTHPESDFCAKNIITTATGMRFDCRTPKGYWSDIVLNLWGQHNVLNALAVIVACVQNGVSEGVIRKGLSTFLGVARRLTHVGNKKGIPVIDDYAHHPTEISAVLKTLHDRGYRRILAICQPHRYTRLHDTMDLFTTCFQYAHAIVLLPVYSAGELPIVGAESTDLAQKLIDLGHKVHVSGAVSECHDKIDVLCNMEEYDVIICVGAGDITSFAKDLARSFSDAD